MSSLKSLTSTSTADNESNGVKDARALLNAEDNRICCVRMRMESQDVQVDNVAPNMCPYVSVCVSE